MPHRKQRSPWVSLLAAITLEVMATMSLRASEGFTRPGWLVAVVLGYVGSFWLLSVVLRRGVPVAVAYGIWSSVGVSAVALLAFVLFEESLTLVTLCGLAVVIVGVLMIELGSRGKHHSAVGAER